jgi:hypothetical protein
VNKANKKILSYNTLYWSHIGVLLLGFFAGILAAYYFTSIQFDFSSELEKARKLGIVSRTILTGYPKSKDILAYASVLGFPVLFSVGIWLLWARKERLSNLKEIFCITENISSPKTTGWSICLLSVLIYYLFISFNLTYFYTPNYNSAVGAWPFLGEEGMTLAWVQSIFSGGVYGKDFFSVYGPMLIYPLAFVMKLFGISVSVERFYTYFLNLIAYGIIIVFLYRTLKWKAVFLVSSFFYIFIFSPFKALSPNTTYLRVALGFLPLLFALQYLENGKGYSLLLIGLFMGQCLLFSQEVGLCTVFSIIAYFFFLFIQKGSGRLLTKSGIYITMGCLASIAPALYYFYMKGALASFFENMYEFPKLMTLGFNALPFPNLKYFIANPFEIIIMYWVIFIYVFTLIYHIPLMLLGKLDKDNILKASLLIFGILLFRSALGRSGEYHVFYASPPAFLIAFLFFDNAITGIIKQNFGFKKVGNFILAIGLIMSICLLIINSAVLKNNFVKTKHFGFDFRTKWALVESGSKVLNLERCNVFFDYNTALSISSINKFLEINTKPRDYVYFFPHEPAYYFVFDRNNPTRYAGSYFAITSEQRRELVADLDNKTPKYVIYSLKTWRIDNIMEDIQVPEVVKYLKEKYSPILKLGDILILERVNT